MYGLLFILKIFNIILFAIIDIIFNLRNLEIVILKKVLTKFVPAVAVKLIMQINYINLKLNYNLIKFK